MVKNITKINYAGFHRSLYVWVGLVVIWMSDVNCLDLFPYFFDLVRNINHFYWFLYFESSYVDFIELYYNCFNYDDFFIRNGN